MFIVFTIFNSEIGNISSKYWLPNKSAEDCLYTRHLTPLCHFQEKICTLHCRSFYRNLFLTVTKVYDVSGKYWLLNKSAKKIFLHKTLNTPPVFQNKLSLSMTELLVTSIFITFVPVFSVDEVCNILNKYHFASNLAKYHYFYTRDFISFLHFEKRLALSIANVFRNIHFLPHFHYFQQWGL